MEGAHSTSLARDELGLCDNKREVTLGEFIQSDVKPAIESRFVDKPKTLEHYWAALKLLASYPPSKGCPLGSITADKLAG